MCDLGVVGASSIFGWVRGTGVFTVVLPTFVLVPRMQLARQHCGHGHFLRSVSSSWRKAMVVGALARASVPKWHMRGFDLRVLSVFLTPHSFSVTYLTLGLPCFILLQNKCNHPSVGITVANLWSINLVSIFRCSSPPINPVYVRRVDPSGLPSSLSSNRY